MKPIVAIVGRPNVGKSTFFNRVTRTRDALVDDLPGVTRDRHYGDAEWDGVTFTLVDTGGFSEGDVDRFAGDIRIQVEQAIRDADVVVLMLDGKHGLSPFDRDIVTLLHDGAKRAFYVVNKIDNPEQEQNLYEFYSLGVDALHPLSAEHRYGLVDFMDDLVASFSDLEGKEPDESEKERVRLAVVGRPNVGKSSLINKVLGEERLLVSDIPGTTRDAIDTACEIDGKSYLLVDTAGIRRKGKVRKKLEKFSVVKALRSLDRCDVALIVIDASEGVTDQDVSVAGYAHDRGCGCVLVLNKWDLVEKDSNTVKKYLERVRMAAKFLTFAPVITTSALTGQRVRKIFSLVERVHAQYVTRIGTGQLNRIIARATEKNEPSLHRGRRIKFYYATQTSAGPPTFLLFVNYPEAVHFSYKRYLVNRIRQEARLSETPIRLLFRKREGRKRK